MLLPTSYTFSLGSQVSGAGTNLWTGGTITINTTVSASNVQLAGATLAGTNTFTGMMNWTGGTIAGVVTIAATAVLNMSGPLDKTMSGGVLTNAGTVTWTDVGNLVWDCNGGLFHNSGTFDVRNEQSLYDWCGVGVVFQNAGLFRKSAGTGSTTMGSTVAFNNTGTVDIRAGTLSFGASFSNAVGAVLQGFGTLDVSGTSFNNLGQINPGDSAGTLTIIGNLPQTSSSVINIELGGSAPANYDRLVIAGAAQLDGTLSVKLINGFVPSAGNVFTALTYSASSGTFAMNNADTLGLRTVYTPSNIVLTVGNSAPSVTLSAPSTQLVCAPFLLEATASDLEGPVTNVDLLIGTSVLASFANPPYRLRLAYDFPGTVTFSVRAYDRGGAVGTASVSTVFHTPPLHVLSLGGIKSNGAFKFCMLGEAGRNYEVLATNDVSATNWPRIGVMEATNGIWRFTDLAATNFPMRFYRARQLP